TSRRRPSAPAGPWRGRALHSNYYPHARSSSLPPPKAYIAFGSTPSIPIIVAQTESGGPKPEVMRDGIGFEPTCRLI
ncbi:MAG: hypothetical protein ACLQNE_12405, partial [Thermoguttaceae bacterium]